ncbi:MAG: hypothetical protein ACR2N7_04320 [Acidimicrobiia bacterium]
MKRRTAVVLMMVCGMLGLQLPALAGDTVGLVDPASGQWHLKDGGATQSFYYGDPGDIPFMGDWDCDGVATPGLFRQSDAFAYLRNSNSQGNADIRFFFGNPSDIPLAGDFNGDGCDTLSIYRPSEARFYIVNKLGTNNGGLGPADYSFVFGNPGDNPFAGDFDGDGITEVGLHREATGFVYYRNTLTTGNAHNSFFFGDPGDRFVAGDWSEADIVALAAGPPDTPAIFRPGDATFYFRDSNSQGNATAVLPFGAPSFVPVAGDTGSAPLQLGHPPRSPSPSTPTSFDCLNPIGFNTICGGDTDPAGQGDEAWICIFFGSDVWDCEGNIDTTDVADELWNCSIAASGSDWNCDGDIDKRRPGSEAWSCSVILGVGWGCSGNIDGRSGTAETWTCSVTAVSPVSWTCAGDVDRSSPTQEKWNCATTNGVDWTCDGSHAWNAPIVSSINGFVSFGSQGSATALSEGPSVALIPRAAAAFGGLVPS